MKQTSNTVKFSVDRIGEGNRNVLGTAKRNNSYVYSYVSLDYLNLEGFEVFDADGNVKLKRGQILEVPSKLAIKCKPQD